MKSRTFGVSLLVTLAIAALVGSAEAAATPKKKPATPVVDKVPSKPKPVIDAFTGMEFLLVKGGCYQMGDTFGDGEDNQKPTHEVCVGDFLLGKYEVTQSQWEKVMGTNPSMSIQCGPNCPVDSVSWEMTQEFIQVLNDKSGKQYRLPTEAEWEYAARSGGKKEKWAGTSDAELLADYAWYGRDMTEGKSKVGQKKANGLGLHDMSGNVLEWCQDWYGDSYYKESPKDRPVGPASGEKRVLRGGVFSDGKAQVGAAFRVGDDPVVTDGNNGLRLLLPVTK